MPSQPAGSSLALVMGNQRKQNLDNIYWKHGKFLAYWKSGEFLACENEFLPRYLEELGTELLVIAMDTVALNELNQADIWRAGRTLQELLHG